MIASTPPARNALFVRAWQHMAVYAGSDVRTQDAVSDTAEDVWVWANERYPETIDPADQVDAVRRIENYWHGAVRHTIARQHKLEGSLDYGVDVTSIPMELRSQTSADVEVYWENVLERAATLDHYRPSRVSRRALVDQLWRGAYQTHPETYQPDSKPLHLALFSTERLDQIVVRSEPVLRAHGLELEGGFVRTGRGGLPAPRAMTGAKSLQLWKELVQACGEHAYLVYVVLADTGTLDLGVGWATLCATLLAHEHGLPTTEEAVRDWSASLRSVAQAVQDAYEKPNAIWTDTVGSRGGVRNRLQPAPVRS